MLDFLADLAVVMGLVGLGFGFIIGFTLMIGVSIETAVNFRDLREAGHPPRYLSLFAVAFLLAAVTVTIIARIMV